MYRSLFIFFLICNLNFAQIQKDTTFTTHSEYLKQIKKYPFIKIPENKNFEKIKEFQDIIYKNIGNRSLKLDVYLYPSIKKLPALIILHGGGWKSGSKEMQNQMAKEIANKGYQVFSLEYRLSDEARYPAAIDDIADALNFIRKIKKKYNVDTTKIAILGCSSGAQMATLAGEKFNKSIKAIINIDGILAFHHPESKEGKYAELWLGGTYEQIPEIWKDASPISHITKKSPPILFINSQFNRFHAGRDDMIKKLDTFGIYTKIEKFENSPHTFWLFEPWFQPTIKYVTEFLNQTLKKIKFYL